MSKELKHLTDKPAPKQRCRSCKGCLKDNCGKCMFCKDMPKYGGEYTLKKACIERKCEQLASPQVSTERQKLPRSGSKPSVTPDIKAVGAKSKPSKGVKAANLGSKTGGKSTVNNVSQSPAKSRMEKTPGVVKTSKKGAEKSATPIISKKGAEKSATPIISKKGAEKSATPIISKKGAEKSATPIISKKGAEKSATPIISKKGAEKSATPIISKKGAEKSATPIISKKGAEKSATPIISKKGAEKSATPIISKKGAEKSATPIISKKGAEKSATPIISKKGAEKSATPIISKKGAEKSATPIISKKGAEKSATPSSSKKEAEKSSTPIIRSNTKVSEEKARTTADKNSRNDVEKHNMTVSSTKKVQEGKSTTPKTRSSKKVLEDGNTTPAVISSKKTPTPVAKGIKTTEKKAETATATSNTSGKENTSVDKGSKKEDITGKPATPASSSKKTVSAETMTVIADVHRSVTEGKDMVTTPANKEINLPTIDMDSMTQAELKAFIPEMLKLVTGREEVWHSRRSAKPSWWPVSVAWATCTRDWQLQKPLRHSLQEMIHSCYRHFGQGDKLAKAGISMASPHTSPYKQSPVKDDESSPSSPIKTATFPQDILFPFCAEIYICYFCEKEFLNKKKMRDHQKECSERPPQLQQYQPVTVVTDDKVHNEPPPMSPPKRNVLHMYSPLSLKHFCGYMDLVPKQTAAKLRANRASMEIDCNLEEIEPPTSPVTPVTPRTPRSLISQLSRDDSGALAKKRLSYSLSVDKEKELEVVSDDSSDSEENQSGMSNRESKPANLLNIPVSSLLGQRIKNYVHGESPMSVVDNIEVFCRTPVKNSFLEKLRKKASMYPCMYRPRRLANLHKQNHLYKFTKKEVQDFMCKLNTGLNRKSLEKVKLTRPVRIVVEKMTRKQLLKWVPPYILDRKLHHVFKRSKTMAAASKVSSHCEFPSGPTLLAPNIDKLLGLKRKSSLAPKSPVNAPLSLGNFISEEMEAEVSKQKLTLYRCLLYEMSVLTPAVVMEDMRSEHKPKHTPIKKNKMSAVSGLIDRLDDQESTPVFVVKASPQKVKPAAVVNKEEPKKSSVDKYSQYKTLVSLLDPKGTSEKLHKSEIPEAKDSAAKQSPIKSLLETRVFRTPDSSPVVISAFGDGPTHSAKRQVSPEDDTVSIISLSSDGDSATPGCCVACRNKFLRSPCQCNVESPSLNSSMQMDGAKMAKDRVLKPIDIVVDDSLFKPSGVPSTNEVMYGIPSPVSTRSESPLPPTPTKDLPSPNKMAMTDDIHAFSPVVPDIDITDTPVSVESAHKGSFPEGMFVPNRLRTLRSTSRSKSLTPSSSPVKIDTLASSSLPNSPEKAALMVPGSFDATHVSSAKRNIFSGTIGKMRTRSIGLTAKDEIEKMCLKNSGKITEPLLKSGSQIEQPELEKGVDMRKSESDSDMPVRRSKRKASTRLSVEFDYSAPPTKLRKWNSEYCAYS